MILYEQFQAILETMMFFRKKKTKHIYPQFHSQVIGMILRLPGVFVHFVGLMFEDSFPRRWLPDPPPPPAQRLGEWLMNSLGFLGQTVFEKNMVRGQPIF